MKDIECILSVSVDEEILFVRIIEKDDVDSKYDVVVDIWMNQFGKGYIIRFKGLFDEDVVVRKVYIIENDVNEIRFIIGILEIMVKLNILVELVNGKDRKWESG